MISISDFKKTLKSNISLIMVLAIFAIFGIVLLNYYQYAPINRDLFSLLSIAKIYANGNYFDAINGYWGPLFSWLLVPFIKFNSTPSFILYSSKVLSLIIGFFTLVGVILLSYRFEMDEKIRTILLFSIIPLILYFTFGFEPQINHPDLLLACFLIYYLYYIFNPNYSFNLSDGILCGLFAALAYLTKSYAFPFFLVHFVLFNVFHYYKANANRKGVFKNFILGLTVFLIISGAWSAIISEKYGELTFGTSGKYNYKEIGPIQHNYGSPIWHGFMNPPSNEALSAWDDPSYFDVRSWSPLESWSSFKHQIQIIKDNITKTVKFLEKFSYFSILILLIYILVFIRPLKEVISKKTEVLFPLATVLLYIAGYIPIFVEFRYLVLVYILLILMGGYIINLLFKNKFFTKKRIIIVLLIFILSFTLLPANSLIAGMGNGKYIALLADDINPHHIKGNIASNDDYMLSLALSYYLESRYFGTSMKNWKPISDSELEKDFNTYNIDYYFVWGKSNNDALLSKYKEISGGKIEGLKIYSIKNET